MLRIKEEARVTRVLKFSQKIFSSLFILPWKRNTLYSSISSTAVNSFSYKNDKMSELRTLSRVNPYVSRALDKWLNGWQTFDLHLNSYIN